MTFLQIPPHDCLRVDFGAFALGNWQAIDYMIVTMNSQNIVVFNSSLYNTSLANPPYYCNSASGNVAVE